MVKLRAEEQRYLVSATGAEEALVRRIPGCRHVAAAGALALSRQPGSLLALDRLFGPQGWEHGADLAEEVSEARGRQILPAQQQATVALVGQDLSVECSFGDKELVKLVPGYRWSAPQRRWFLPSAPMALDVLAEHFGDLLKVEEAVAKLLELKRADEDAALERSRTRPTKVAPEAALAPAESPAERREPASEEALSEALPEPQALLLRLDRLTSAVEELVAALKGAGVAPTVRKEQPEEELAVEGPASEEAGSSDWRELLGLLDGDPAAVRDQALRDAQTAPHELEAPFRAVAGIAAARLGEHTDAVAWLRRAMEREGALDEDLAREARPAYVAAILSILYHECGPERPLESAGDFRDRLLEELVNDDGFEDGKLGSVESRSRLEYLVRDPVLRRISPELSDYSRMAHMLGVARGGQWMAAPRIVDVLREDTLGDEGFAFALMLLANALYEGKCVNEWNRAWPREDVADSLENLAWLVGAAEERLQKLDGALAEPAALACLACIAGGLPEWASTSQRKALVQLISPRNPSRREYAEFLAAFQPAAAGQRSVLGLFPGWTKVLAQTRLSRSAPYLMDVAANDNGGAGSLTWALAEDVYLQAMSLWGIEDAQTELIDLLDLLEGGGRPDNHLNEAGRLVEDTEGRWTGGVSREQRKVLFRRALESSLKHRHDRDTTEAFDRLIRELRDEGDSAEPEILSTCNRLSTAMRAVRGPALEVLLGIQLEKGLPFEETAEQLVNAGPHFEEVGQVIAGLSHLFPAFRAWWNERKPDAELKHEPVSFPDKKLLVVGGHKWLEHRAKPVLEEEWKVKLTWLDPDQVKNGERARALARGCDLVVVSAACIGHSGSGRVIEEAKAAGVPLLTHHLRAPAAMLAAVAQKLGPGDRHLS